MPAGQQSNSLVQKQTPLKYQTCRQLAAVALGAESALDSAASQGPLQQEVGVRESPPFSGRHCQGLEGGTRALERFLSWVREWLREKPLSPGAVQVLDGSLQEPITARLWRCCMCVWGGGWGARGLGNQI